MENLYSTDEMNGMNFEIYPQVKSVSPSIGSVEGGTLITITGSGFATTMPDADPVSVQVGGVDCDVESMTSSQILCRTPKIDVPQVPVREFFETLENWDCGGSDITGSHYKNHPSVQTLEECSDLCLSVARCDQIAWRAADKNCWLKHRSYSCRAYTGLTTRTITPVETTDCIYGRGINYVGDINITEDGAECVEGTFCRNPQPEKYDKPFCNSTRTHMNTYCSIIECDQKFGPYLGSRGLLADYSPYGLYKAKMRSHKTYKLQSHIRDNTFLMKGNTFSKTGYHDKNMYSAWGVHTEF